MKGITMLFAVVIGLVTSASGSRCDFKGTDVWWGDIYNYMAPSLEACKDSCRNDIRCTAITYWHWGIATGKCFLKNSGHGSQISCAWCTTAFKPCMDDEVACPAGQKRVSGKCEACPRDTYSKAGSDSCTACPAGTSSEPGSESCSVTPCPLGSHHVAGSCQPCPANTYSDVAGAVSCKSCGDGYTSPVGSTSASACKALPVVNCWVLHQNVRLTGSYGGMVPYKKAAAACKDDAACTGVSCQRRKGNDDLCTLSNGKDPTKAKKKWYVYLKEC